MSDRTTARVSDEIKGKLKEWSKKLGVTESQLAGMAITAGLGAILRAVSPEDAVSPELLAKVTLAMNQLNEADLQKLGVSYEKKEALSSGA